MIEILIIFLILFLVFITFSTTNKETFYNFSTASIRRYISSLTKRIDRIELLLHKNELHNETQAKINEMKKKYDPAYNYYAKRHMELKKASQDNLKEFSS